MIYNFFIDKTPVWDDCEGALQQATNCRKVYKITSYLSYLICYLWLVCSINVHLTLRKQTSEPPKLGESSSTLSFVYEQTTS
jgi:hypothetical protein